MAYDSSSFFNIISSSSTSHESSTYSSACSSPSSLPQPPIAQTLSKSSVPFLWEEKPGVTKPRNETTFSSSSLKASTNLFYGKSLEYPPLPPPPRLSQAFLSQPRSRESKLLGTLSLLRRRLHEASFKMPSSKGEEEGQDPFFLALKACTKGENRYSRVGLPAALRDLFKPTKEGQRSMGSKEVIQGGSKKNFEESDGDHQWMKEERVNGDDDYRRRGHGKPKHNNAKIDEFININQGQGKPKHNNHAKVADGFNDINQGQGKPKHNNAMVDGFNNINQGPGKPKNNIAKVDGFNNINQEHHKPKHNIAKVDEFSNINQGHHKPKHNAKVAQFGDINNQGRHKPKHNAKVVEFNSCRGFIIDNEYIELHSSTRQSIFTDLLGCKGLHFVNGAAIHPSFMVQNKPFSFRH